MKYGDFSMKKAYTFYVSVVADPVCWDIMGKLSAGGQYTAGDASWPLTVWTLTFVE